MQIYSPNSYILAPLAGYTDIPFRNSARRHGCKYAFTEMVDANSLVFGNRKSLRFLERGESEEWLGTQLVGGGVEELSKATHILNQYQFDVLDLNLGCPSPKVAKKGAGAALGKQIDTAAKCAEEMVKISNFPVTAKIRILDEEDATDTISLVKKLETAGVNAVTIHGRIQKSFYSGPVFFDIIKSVQEASNLQIISNGGAFGYDTANELKDKTNCNVIMFARGAMGNPWIFNELIDNKSFNPPTVEEFTQEVKLHLEEMINYYGEEFALKISRKVVLDYLKGRGYNSSLRAKISFLKNYEDFNNLITEIAIGPSDRYWDWLNHNKNAPRKLKHN